MSWFDVLRHPNKMLLALSMALRLTILVALVSAVLHSQWLIVFTCVLSLFLTFLPAILSRNLKFYLPIEFELILVVFIYLAVFLGEVHSYYLRFWWWDIMLHGISGILLGFVGFLMLFILYEEGKVKAMPGLIALFSFCFALAMGALWEIFEFSMDTFFGLNMQKPMLGDESGLTDTMLDLVIDAIGALIASLYGYLYLKGKRSRLFEAALKRFVKKNRHLYNKGHPRAKC